MQQQLQLAGRLAAVGELAAGVAHELNNPLAAIQAYAQLLNERDDIDDTTAKDVSIIYGEAQRAAQITNNLLSFARQHRPEKRYICLNEVIEKSLELQAYQLEMEKIDIVTKLDPDLPKTMADFHQMQQVFVNIVTNAEEAMTESHDRGKLVVTTESTNEKIRITFTDDGPGIPHTDLVSIFDPFYTTKNVGKGTGLGLSICYGIIREHGGYISIKSSPNEGTTVIVEIPVIPEDALTTGSMACVHIKGVRHEKLR
jgi:two-component system NtrC family sensor kinase